LDCAGKAQRRRRFRPHESGVALSTAVHDASRNSDAPGKSVRVMDCAGNAAM
jgi:hypothetical protein